MYKINQSLLGITISSVVAVMNVIASASAATINFEIDFFDNDNNQVGSGTFSYDNESLACFERTPEGVCDPEDRLYGFDAEIVTNVVTDFSATTYGVDWNGIYNYWWSDDDSEQSPGAAISARFPAFNVLDNSWFFGDPFLGEEQNTMSFEESSDNFARGTWSQYIVDPPPTVPQDSPDLPFFFSADGIWEANIIGITPEPSNPSSIPESTNILGILVAIGFGYGVKRKATQSK